MTTTPAPAPPAAGPPTPGPATAAPPGTPSTAPPVAADLAAGGDVAGAVAALRSTYDAGTTRPLAWRLAQLAAVRAMLREREDDLAAALEADLGKPAVESRLTETAFVAADAAHVARHLRRWTAPRRVASTAQLAPSRASVVREPLGVVCVIAPWNYPVQLLLSPVVGALAAGNTVLAKPSELAPATSAALARWLPRYLDPTAVAVVQGGAEVSTEILAQRYDHVLYTGGERVGRIVSRAAAEHLTPVTLELGGKCPAWVDDGLDDAELASAARRIAWGRFLNAGQTCVAVDHVLTTPSTAPRLETALVEAVRAMFGDQPRASRSYGRMVSAAAARRVEGYLGDGRVVCGGEVDVEERYVAPTVLADVDPSSAVMNEEVFGPVLPIVTVPDEDAAIASVTARPRPLALYVFVPDARAAGAARRWGGRTSSGALGVNAPVLHLTVPTLPFGGVGASGHGAYHGEASVALFSHDKAVLTKPLRPDTLRALYPPYTGLKAALVRRVIARG